MGSKWSGLFRKDDGRRLRYIVGTLLKNEDGLSYYILEIQGEQEYSHVKFRVDLEISAECKNVLSEVNFGSRYVFLYNTSGNGHYHNQLVGLWRIAE